MGKRYADELSYLGETWTWATALDASPLEQFARNSRQMALVAVGSGGSLAAAHFGALLHRHLGGGQARHSTPLEFIWDEPALGDTAVLLISASGKNKDVLTAVDSAVKAEVPVLGAITTRSPNPLAQRVDKYARGYSLSDSIPTGKDGFLATNSLLGTFVLLARGYGVKVGNIATKQAVSVSDVIRDTFLVLHGSWGSPVATDLESRLHESALANAQLSDYRNFGHGRHLWLSKRRESTSIVAIIGPDTKSLAEKTLRLLPDDVPVIRLATELVGPRGTIELLFQAMHLVQDLGDFSKTDPGRPHVPMFGRKLFHLSPSIALKTLREAPIERKLKKLSWSGDVATSLFKAALERFVSKLATISIGAVVFDYDGTLCRTDRRFDPLTDEIKGACTRLLRLGLKIGIATGRGVSVRSSLREAIPEEFWDSILIGYYNGSEQADLRNDSAPHKNGPTNEELGKAIPILRSDPVIQSCANLEVRRNQITITPTCDLTLSQLYLYVNQLLAKRTLRLLTSAHSIDVLDSDVSKTKVVEILQQQVSPLEVLCIGDRGAWPGNDVDLLSTAFSLSVDQVSSSLDTCWHLAPPGEIGPDATVYYLNSIEASNAQGRLDLRAKRVLGK